MPRKVKSAFSKSTAQLKVKRIFAKAKEHRRFVKVMTGTPLTIILPTVLEFGDPSPLLENTRNSKSLERDATQC
jgi:hypothetical protein